MRCLLPTQLLPAPRPAPRYEDAAKRQKDVDMAYDAVEAARKKARAFAGMGCACADAFGA